MWIYLTFFKKLYINIVFNFIKYKYEKFLNFLLLQKHKTIISEFECEIEITRMLF